MIPVINTITYILYRKELLSLSIMSQAGNLTDQAVVNSMISGFQWTDLFYPISMICAIFVYRRIKPFATDNAVVWVPLVTVFCFFVCYFFL